LHRSQSGRQRHCGSTETGQVVMLPQFFPRPRLNFASAPIERSMTTSVGTEKPHEALLERALLLCQQGRFPEAERILRRFLELEPCPFEVLYFLGIICSQQGNDQEALRHIDAALGIDPQSADAHNSRGNVLAALKRFDDAVASFDTAI